MRITLPTRLAFWRTVTMTGAFAVAIAAPMTAAAPVLQAPPSQSPPSASIRPSVRTAANRVWFQLATLVRRVPDTGVAAGTTLQVVAANGVTLRELIGFAYLTDRGALTRSQVIGAPEWADTQRFDVIVPVPEGSGAGLTYNADGVATGGAGIPALQRLLTDAFGLRVRRDQQNLPGIDLVAIGGAAKPDLKPSTASCVQADPAQRCSFTAGPGFITVRGMTMNHLATQLAWNFPAITRPVRDRTDLAGKYDYTLSFVPAFLTAPNPTAPNVANPVAGIGLTLQQALEERLGLRLTDTSATFDVVVVEGVQPLNR